MSGDIPSISASTYASQAYGLDSLGAQGFAALASGGTGGLFGGAQSSGGAPIGQLIGRRHATIHPDRVEYRTEETGIMANPKRRLVQVLIMDPNENVPLESCLLYRGDQKLTDATDAELYFEIDIKDILAKHNQNRVKLVDKKVKERVEYLEPAKIRDLKMVVVTVAEF